MNREQIFEFMEEHATRTPLIDELIEKFFPEFYVYVWKGEARLGFKDDLGEWDEEESIGT